MTRNYEMEMTKEDHAMEIASLEAWVQGLLDDKAALERELVKSDRENDELRSRIHCPVCSQDLSLWEV